MRLLSSFATLRIAFFGQKPKDLSPLIWALSESKHSFSEDYINLQYFSFPINFIQVITIAFFPTDSSHFKTFTSAYCGWGLYLMHVGFVGKNFLGLLE